MPSRLLSCAIVLLAASPLWARPPHKESLKRHYGELLADSLNACTTCHLSREQVDDPESFDAEYPPHNDFGVRLRELGEELEEQEQPRDIPTRLERVAAEDADGDGVANELEILAGRAPGNAQQTPTADELAAATEVSRRFALERSRYRWRPFEPVARPEVPLPARQEWVRNPIDAFIAAAHEEQGLAPRPPAPPHVLLRRVYLDLVGLPPTRQELQAFLSDSSPDAYEKVVDQLLASPRYGERWGRHWMDVWRYSDWAGWTDGKQIRDSQPHIWRWRDWIVESLNLDRGYDEMVRQMVAGDELYPADPDVLRATGYLARNYKMLSRETWLQDTVNHTFQAFLGLTIGCARCHDHRYDAISQEEYYEVRAVFEPHNVRLDRLPGQSDTTVDGLARVFDAELTAPTYLFVRGDDRQPDKEHPLQPGIPELLDSAPFEIQPVELPASVYYPGLKTFVQREAIVAAEAALAEAQAAFDQANQALAEAPPAATTAEDAPASVVAGAADEGATGSPPEQPAQAVPSAAELAARKLALAQAKLAFERARIEADNARYAEPAADNAAALATAAARAEREAKLLESEVELLSAQQNLASAKAVMPSDEKAAQAVTEAEKALTEASQKREAAAAALAEETSDYAPLGPVYPTTSSGRRTALARWLTDNRNPLAARVAANHIWLRHFGEAIVPTVFEFGQNGKTPSHPALLDWLAAELMEPTWGGPAHAWSMKHLHRLMVTSNTYRMASTPHAEALARDPENRWLWRMPSRRMEAELVRDGILYVAGQLDPAMGGPDIDYALGLSEKRRSIYFRHAQEKQMEFLKMFDCAAVTECYQRKESIVPQQALALANSELTLVQARLLARRLNAQIADPTGFVAAAFEQVLARPATAEEQQASIEFLDQQASLLASHRERVAATAGEPNDAAKPSADPALRARENLVHVLLNHNDFITIR